MGKDLVLVVVFLLQPVVVLSQKQVDIKYHTFIAPGTFTVGPVTAVDVLAAGGGGAGGSYYGGGGGGGGVVRWLNVSLVNVPELEIAIGDGGGNTSPGTNSGAPGGLRHHNNGMEYYASSINR